VVVLTTPKPTNPVGYDGLMLPRALFKVGICDEFSPGRQSNMMAIVNEGRS
jgi:hypothetical protein